MYEKHRKYVYKNKNEINAKHTKCAKEMKDERNGQEHKKREMQNVKHMHKNIKMK